MKIFESTQIDERENSPIIQLLENDLSIQDKMEKLRDSISVVKLTQNGEKDLLNTLFSKLSEEIYFPRKGDNSERFDAIINFSSYKAVTEVEIPSTEILDAPRNLLDDYAVVCNRKNEDPNKIVPLVVCWDLPNKRTDYWNVVTDINSILGIKIKTISILALALYYWTGESINFLNDDFYLNHGDLTIHCVDKILKKNGISANDYPGYFTPFK